MVCISLFLQTMMCCYLSPEKSFPATDNPQHHHPVKIQDTTVTERVRCTICMHCAIDYHSVYTYTVSQLEIDRPITKAVSKLALSPQNQSGS